LAESEADGADKIGRIVQDIGASNFELRWLSARGADDAELLFRRMAALRLNPAEFGRIEPRLFHELRRLCAMCQSKDQCARGIADEFSDPAWQDWREYCPNATILSVMSALRGCHSGDFAFSAIRR